MSKKHNLKIKMNMLICLMALILGTTLMGVYASYTSTKSGDGNANVAQFSIIEEGTIFQTIEAHITPDTQESLELTIKNKSGVDVDYTLTVTNVTGNIKPLRFALTAQEGTSPVTSQNYENGTTTFSVRNVVAGDHIDNYTLKMVWNPSTEGEDYDLSFNGMVDYITIAVTSTSVK